MGVGGIRMGVEIAFKSEGAAIWRFYAGPNGYFRGGALKKPIAD